MAIALALSVLSVAAGALLATAPRVRAIGLGPIRTFSLAAAGVAVLGHLLPEAVSGLGIVALFAFTVALAAPWLLEKLGHLWVGLGRSHAHDHDHEHAHDHPHDDDASRTTRFAIELSFATLLLHQIGDGVALHHYATGDDPSLDAALALSLHTVPVAAVVVLRFARPIRKDDPRGAREWRPALWRAVWLAVATLVGVALGATFASEWLREVAPWTAAIVAGFLLHVLTHDLGRDAPRRTIDRVLELGGLVAGIALAAGALWMGREEHGHAEHAGHDVHADAWGELMRVAHTMLDIAITVAPWALAGLAITTVLRTSLPDRDHGTGPERGMPRVVWLLRRSLCSSGPTELAPTTVLVTLALFGWRLAIARAAGAVLVGLVLGLAGRASDANGPRRRHAHAPDGGERASRGMPFALAETLHANAPRIAFGIVLGGLVHGIVPAHTLDGGGLLAAGALAWMLVAIAVSSDGLLATPIAAALAAKGLMPGVAAAMTLLVSARCGTAFDDPTSAHLSRWRGAAALLVGMLATGAIALAWPSGSLLPLDVAVTTLPFGRAPAYVLGALLAVQLYRCGLRAWIATATGAEHHHHP